MKKIGILICDRYHACAGGKCLRTLRNREGAFTGYEGEEVEPVEAARLLAEANARLCTALDKLGGPLEYQHA